MSGESNLPSPNPSIAMQRDVGEQKWVYSFAVLLLALTTLPYIVGYSVAGEAWYFSGFVFGVEDGNSYIAKMLTGSAGAWLFRSPYSADPQNGILAFTPYLLLGKLASGAGLHEQLVALFHLFRLVAGFLSILASYDFLSFFLKERKLRQIGLALVCAGGGLGWLLMIMGQNQWLGSLPLEFYSPETFGFLGIYGIPHLALGRAALLWCLLAFFKAVTQSKWDKRQAMIVAGLWLLAGMAQPLEALVIGFVIALHLLVGLLRIIPRGEDDQRLAREVWKRSFKLAFASAILPGLFVLYNGSAFLWDPYLRAWSEQNIILSPNPWHYIFAYGLLIPFALKGRQRLAQRNPWMVDTLSAWALSLPLLAYMPFNLQRRLPEGIWVALVILSMGFFLNAEGEGVDSRRKTMTLALGLLFPSTLILLLGGALAVLSPNLPVFRPGSEIATFEHLRQVAEPGDVVLASYDTSNVLPAWAPVRVIVGHGPESAHLADLQPQVEAFYKLSTTDAERSALIRHFNVRFVFWGPLERQLGDWHPGSAGFLRQVYSASDYGVFEVQGGSD